MKIEKTAVEGFTPYTISITVETQEEHEMLEAMTKFDVSIPFLVDKTEGDVYCTAQKFLTLINEEI